MRFLVVTLFATIMLGASCASSDPAAEAKARKERAEEQRANAAKADADLRRATRN